jgi:hypothetical protein
MTNIMVNENHACQKFSIFHTKDAKLVIIINHSTLRNFQKVQNELEFKLSKFYFVNCTQVQ